MKNDTFSFVREALKVAVVVLCMTTKERRGSTPRPDDAEHCTTIPFLQFQSFWLEAERLALVFRQTHQERHLVALERHLAGVFQRLAVGGLP